MWIISFILYIYENGNSLMTGNLFHNLKDLITYMCVCLILKDEGAILNIGIIREIVLLT